MAAAFLVKLQSKSPSNAVIHEDIDNVSCPICLDVYEKPRRIPCGHIFCKSCLSNYEDILEPACPVCRRIFTLNASKKASDIEKTLHSSCFVCRGCEQKVMLSKLKQHYASCSSFLEKLEQGAVAAVAINQPVKSKVNPPNRQTFRCPYCGVQNLDTYGLVKHCNDHHHAHTGQVVCPICASMPWGNPKQKSSNFIYHLNLRHKFQYDFVVDYELDDAAALDKALKASLEEQ